MNYCEMCGAEIEENSILCPKCELRLLPESKSKPKKRMTKKIKIYTMVISYILFIVFSISFFYISSSCYKSNDIKCYRLSLVFLILLSCFCFVAAVLVGEEVSEQF